MWISSGGAEFQVGEPSLETLIRRIKIKMILNFDIVLCPDYSQGNFNIGFFRRFVGYCLRWLYVYRKIKYNVLDGCGLLHSHFNILILLLIFI